MKPLTAPRLLILTLLLLFTSTFHIYAQTTWTGAVSTAWNTAGNWSAGVPNSADDVTILNVANDPIITTSSAAAKSVALQLGGLLTVGTAGVLSINASSIIAFNNQGTVNNNGTVNIGNTTEIVTHGLSNSGTFNNNSGAKLNIDRLTLGSTSALLNMTGSTFTNAGTITIGGLASGGANGIQNLASTFNNLSTGIINISNTAGVGLYTIGDGFSNSGIIRIGRAGSATIIVGLSASGTFNNNAGAQITINRSVYGIRISSSGTIANAGSVTIGDESDITDLIHPQSVALFSNNTGGTFKASGTIRPIDFVNAGGTLSPGHPIGKLTFNGDENFSASTMNIEVNGTGTAGTNYDQVVVNGIATLGGTLAPSINYTPTVGDQIVILNATAIAGTFASVVGLPANWSLIYTPTSVILAYQQLPLTNNWTGAISTAWNTAGNWSGGVPLATDDVVIPNVTRDPLISNNAAVAKSVRVLLGGVLNVASAGRLSINGGSIYGIWNQGTVANNGIIRSGNTSGTGDYSIYNEGMFNNNNGSLFQADRANIAGIGLTSGTVSNAGTVTIGSLVSIPTLMFAQNGTFSNNIGGIVKATGSLPAAAFVNNGGTLAPGYSPGKMTFDATETFTNGTLAMEIDGVGTAGDTYDQIVVAGTATLGGTLNVTINYVPAIGDEFVLVSASSVTGNFSSVTGLPTGWNVVYHATTMVVIYGLPASTWTGTVSTAWNNAGNWSAGVPNGATDVTIPDVATNPSITTSGISVKSVTIETGGLLTVGAAGVLNINASTIVAFTNQGTVNNNGTINIGNVSDIATDGLGNSGTFNNNIGAKLNIDRVVLGSKAALINMTGSTFTNAGTITIGGLASGGGYGLENLGSTFNNLSTGVINISNTAGIGLYLIAEGFSNSGIIRIGRAGSSTINVGLSTSGAFNNNAGAQITINRSTFGIRLSYGTLANAGTITIGDESDITDLIHPQSVALFSNNTGGTFKASGTVRVANFVNAGGTLSPGYPMGKMTFNGDENFSNSTLDIEVNGAGTAGTDYSQVVVNGAATLGGKLDLSINFSGVQGNQIMLVSAATITGTFATVTGLLPNWKLVYTTTSVILAYDLTNTWTGNLSTNWNTPGNWSAGAVPTAANNVIIPNVTNDPIITTLGAVAKTIHVLPGGSLTLNATGNLTTNGTFNFSGINAGIYNQGTVTIKGPLLVKPN